MAEILSIVSASARVCSTPALGIPDRGPERGGRSVTAADRAAQSLWLKWRLQSGGTIRQLSAAGGLLLSNRLGDTARVRCVGHNHVSTDTHHETLCNEDLS